MHYIPLKKYWCDIYFYRSTYIFPSTDWAAVCVSLSWTVASPRNLLHMIHIMCRCAGHIFCETWSKDSRVKSLPFFEILLYSYILNKNHQEKSPSLQFMKQVNVKYRHVFWVVKLIKHCLSNHWHHPLWTTYQGLDPWGHLSGVLVIKNGQH